MIADGSRNGLVANFQLELQNDAGDGSPGYYRLEAGGTPSFSGTGVPGFGAAANTGPLDDRDGRTGSRSRWLLPPAAALPVYLRYELLVDVNGTPVLFSDDPLVSPLAADDPAGAVLLRFQGAQIDAANGQPLAGTVGPWRTRLVPGSGSLNSDRAQLLRFDLVLDKTTGPVQVRELRIVWR